MNVEGWEARYRARVRSAEDFHAGPAPLLVEVADKLPPGRALDLACGTGRNAIWLAGRGWRVTAVDGSAAAIQYLQQEARTRELRIDAQVADLKQHHFRIEPATFDLICISYYLQRDLFEPAKAGVKPGGILLAIVHTTQGDEQPTESRLRPGELAKFLENWEILHSREGASADPAHKRSVAEIVARSPASQ